MCHIPNIYRAYAYCLHKQSVTFICLWHSLIKIKNKRNKTNNPDSCIEKFLGALSSNSHYFPLLWLFIRNLYCAQVIHKPDNLPMDKWEYTVVSQRLPGHTEDKPQSVGGLWTDSHTWVLTNTVMHSTQLWHFRAVMMCPSLTLSVVITWKPNTTQKF